MKKIAFFPVWLVGWIFPLVCLVFALVLGGTITLGMFVLFIYQRLTALVKRGLW